MDEIDALLRQIEQARDRINDWRRAAYVPGERNEMAESKSK